MPKNWFQKPLRLPRVPHSMEDMSHNFKTTTKFGLLTPIGVEEVVPSDKTLEYRPCAFVRLSPLQYPIMHQVHVRVHTFEVPYRIILGDKNYQRFLNSQLEFPEIRVYWDPGQGDTIPDYDLFTTLGYPRVADAGPGDILYYMDNGLDFFSILVIWRDWFADSQLNSTAMSVVDTIIESYQSSLDLSDSYININYSQILTALYCAMGKDYFTTARPEPQYGDPVNLTSKPTVFTADYEIATGLPVETDTPTGEPSNDVILSADGTGLSLDLTIRELWRREQIQKYWDTTNTFGSRTREWLAGHMGVIFPDDRLMIPRLLQTVDRVVNISEVLQTSATEEGGSPLGAYAGKGTLAFSGKSFRRVYVEHGFVISVLSIVPETGYAQSRPRYQFKKNIFDFAIPEFNNIGYQEIYKGELFGDSPKAVAKEPWAYQPRFSEYRSHPNRCSNGFKDDQVLKDFHLNRFFDSLPGLNPSFIKGDQDQFYRIFSDENADMDAFLVDAAIIHKMWRPVTYQPESMHL